MDSSPIVDVRSAVLSIVQQFSEASALFKTWRKGRTGRKAVGQEECETSLYEGKSTIECTLNQLSQRHGATFDRGDRLCLDKLINVRKNFRKAIVDTLAQDVAGKLSKTERLDPLTLRLTSETTRKDSILAMDELSRRITFGTAGLYTMTDPEDVLPPMPVRPLPPLRTANANPSQTSVVGGLQNVSGNGLGQSSFSNPPARQETFTRTAPGMANSGQTSFETPLAPVPQRNNVYMPTSWTLPDFGTSQALGRTRPPNSATSLFRMKDMFPIKPTRPYYDITPLKPTPAVVPTFTSDTDAMDILEEGRRAAEKLWDAVDCLENDRLRLQAHSAPIPQGPWKSMFGDDGEDDEEGHRPQTPLPQREPPSPAPDENDSQMFLRPALLEARSSSVQEGRKIRSEPMLEFTVVTPRFRRHVSSPGARTN